MELLGKLKTSVMAGLTKAETKVHGVLVRPEPGDEVHAFSGTAPEGTAVEMDLPPDKKDGGP
jgi:hypothetical protein